MNHEYWVSCPKMTVWVKTAEDPRGEIIVDTAPIVKKFRGQPFNNLSNWLHRRFPPVEIRELRGA